MVTFVVNRIAHVLIGWDALYQLRFHQMSLTTDICTAARLSSRRHEPFPHCFIRFLLDSMLLKIPEAILNRQRYRL